MLNKLLNILFLKYLKEYCVGKEREKVGGRRGGEMAQTLYAHMN
jgi:hypothetical protein